MKKEINQMVKIQLHFIKKFLGSEKEGNLKCGRMSICNNGKYSTKSNNL